MQDHPEMELNLWKALEGLLPDLLSMQVPCLGQLSLVISEMMWKGSRYRSAVLEGGTGPCPRWGLPYRVLIACPLFSHSASWG